MELQTIQTLIYEIWGMKVMLDFDLADLYGVEMKALKQAVRRNINRFPPDFMFELTLEEYNSLVINLRSQIVTSNRDCFSFIVTLNFGPWSKIYLLFYLSLPPFCQ